MKTHDLDIVLEELTKLDGRTFHNTTESSQAYSWFLMDNMDTIQFALKFTKAALSGEVSGEMVKNAFPFPEWKPSEITMDVLKQEFKAMCKQLAKEIG